MTRVIYFILLAILLNRGTGFGHPLTSAPKHISVLQFDTSSVKTKAFNAHALKEYSRQPAFRYTEEYIQPSLWTRFWRWVWNGIKHFFDSPRSKAGNRNFYYVLFQILKYLFVVLGLGAIIFFILKGAGIDMLSVFRKKSLAATIPYSESLENIHEINFDEQIERAANQHNYRMAVRLLYLKCLKQLSDAGLIKWQPEKTNSAYLAELTDISQQQVFASLTRQFEYIWYGEFSIDGHIFNKIHLLFKEFTQTLR